MHQKSFNLSDVETGIISDFERHAIDILYSNQYHHLKLMNHLNLTSANIWYFVEGCLTEAFLGSSRDYFNDPIEHLVSYLAFYPNLLKNVECRIKDICRTFKENPPAENDHYMHYLHLMVLIESTIVVSTIYWRNRSYIFMLDLGNLNNINGRFYESYVFQYFSIMLDADGIDDVINPLQHQYIDDKGYVYGSKIASNICTFLNIDIQSVGYDAFMIDMPGITRFHFQNSNQTIDCIDRTVGLKTSMDSIPHIDIVETYKYRMIERSSKSLPNYFRFEKSDENDKMFLGCESKDCDYMLLLAISTNIIVETGYDKFIKEHIIPIIKTIVIGYSAEKEGEEYANNIDNIGYRFPYNKCDMIYASMRNVYISASTI